ncbi:MAG: hypothetical protein LBK46_04160 [Oscillospiraceae bacterium]|nr:hypothetical protein [Oscillospiraceae bacterium]
MQSNFDFLTDRFPALAKMGELAETLMFIDPNACLIKIGMLAEELVQIIIQTEHHKYSFVGCANPLDNSRRF